jgi:hypothetical protein
MIIVRNAPEMVVTCAHVAGHYSLGREPVWQEPCTEVLVDGEAVVVVEGDTYNLSVWWTDHGRPIDDLTACTPVGIDHAAAVRHWIQSLGTNTPAYIPMQNAGLFGSAEFTDESEVA